MYDLHTHTTASDGTFTPTEQVRLAVQAGLSGLAITDHDTLSGISEAQAEASKHGIEVIAGVEISTIWQGKDIHVLGYDIRLDDQTLLQRLTDQRKIRDARNELMLARLQQLGISLTMQDVLDSLQQSKKQDDTLGRPHFADALIRKGYVASFNEAFDRFLRDDGPAFVKVDRIEPAVAIRWIKEAGGTPVLAHPGLYDCDALIGLLANEGLIGLEVEHADHDEAQVAHYRKLATEFGLVMTAGSDFHGVRQGEVFHAPLGSRTVTKETIEQLRSYRSR